MSPADQRVVSALPRSPGSRGSGAATPFSEGALLRFRTGAAIFVCLRHIKARSVARFAPGSETRKSTVPASLGVDLARVLALRRLEAGGEAEASATLALWNPGGLNTSSLRCSSPAEPGAALLRRGPRGSLGEGAWPAPPELDGGTWCASPSVRGRRAFRHRLAPQVAGRVSMVPWRASRSPFSKFERSFHSFAREGEARLGRAYTRRGGAVVLGRPRLNRLVNATRHAPSAVCL